MRVSSVNQLHTNATRKHKHLKSNTRLYSWFCLGVKLYKSWEQHQRICSGRTFVPVNTLTPSKRRLAFSISSLELILTIYSNHHYCYWFLGLNYLYERLHLLKYADVDH